MLWLDIGIEGKVEDDVEELLDLCFFDRCFKVIFRIASICVSSERSLCVSFLILSLTATRCWIRLRRIWKMKQHSDRSMKQANTCDPEMTLKHRSKKHNPIALPTSSSTLPSIPISNHNINTSSLRNQLGLNDQDSPYSAITFTLPEGKIFWFMFLEQSNNIYCVYYLLPWCFWLKFNAHFVNSLLQQIHY